MDLSKRLFVPYSAERMFDLIEAAEHYPEFLPWCAAATIVLRTDDVVVADIVVQHKGVRFEFRTRNPKRRPEAMSIRLERGPFRRFEGEWRLAPLGSEGCRVEFEMRYDFNSVMARLAGPVFDRITNAMVDAYVARADELFGRTPVAQPSASAAAADAVVPWASAATPGPLAATADVSPAATSTTPELPTTPAPDAAAPIATDVPAPPTNPDLPRSQTP
jgi:ribosome-associated toxin RatA of RatAB toxin-antitoxin module